MHYPFTLPSLPYSYDALSPNIDGRTLGYHHDKHMAACVETLNGLLAPYPQFQSWSLERLCLNWDALPCEIRGGVRSAAGGVFCHARYFLCMAPPNTTSVPENLAAAIDRDFSSMAGFRAIMKSAALAAYGSGFSWLVTDASGGLYVQTLPYCATPLPLVPLCCCDMWEHAYYLQYQNRRAEYAENFLGLLNWDYMGKVYGDVRAGDPPWPLD
jgi:Fe-Mn family superoxide dismutase